MDPQDGRDIGHLDVYDAHAAWWARKKTISRDFMDHIDTLVDGMEAPLIVDLGSGGGRLLHRLAPRVRHAAGLDVSAELLRHSREKAVEEGLENVSFIEGDAEGTDVWKGLISDLGKPDLVVSNLAVRKDCLRLIPVLHRLRENIAPGGQAWMRVQAGPDLKELIGFEVGYTRKEVESAVAEVNAYGQSRGQGMGRGEEKGQMHGPGSLVLMDVVNETFHQDFSSVDAVRTFLERTAILALMQRRGSVEGLDMRFGKMARSGVVKVQRHYLYFGIRLDQR